MGAVSNAEPAIVVGKCYDLTLWVLQKVEKFPRAHRFTVGDRLVQESLDLLLLLVEAAYRSKKAATLDAAQRKINGVRSWADPRDGRSCSFDRYYWTEIVGCRLPVNPPMVRVSGTPAPVGAFAGMKMLIWTSPAKPGARPAKNGAWETPPKPTVTGSRVRANGLDGAGAPSMLGPLVSPPPVA